MTDTLHLPGMAAPGRITVDRWGIAHIRAETRADLFFLQGFNAARDRLWQIDLWRKRGLGLLAGDFGPGYLEQDKAARLFLYRGDMAPEWAAYGPDAEMICTRFAEGINAFIALCKREPERLPPEFGLMGTAPARWRAEDVVRIRSHGLTRNAHSELLRHIVLSRADVATDLLRKDVEPWLDPDPHPDVPPGSLPLDTLDPFRLAQAPVTFPPERLRATRAEAHLWRGVDDLGEVVQAMEATGSNNWALDGTRTNTGLPILASDPHRAHALPSLRYIVHLSCPDLDVIGAGEPSVPGVSLGFNGTAAFGLTIFYADQEDVLVYDTDPAAADRYGYSGGFETMRVIEETIPVRGGPDEPVRLTFTRHGPVVWRNAERTKAVAVRSVWFEPGCAAYVASLAMMGATTLDAFRAGARGWGTPSVNMLYADKAGTIAWFPCGRMPIRRGWTGLLPVPGDGRYEWAGFHALDDLPLTVNPPGGFVFSANEMNLPPDWDHGARPIGHEWTEPSRARRIREVLARGETADVAFSQALQTDTVSMPARRLCALLAALPGRDPARDLFAGWDHRLDADSAPAALVELWWTKHLKPALMARLVPDAALRKLLVPGDIEALLRALEHPDARFGDDPVAARDRLLAETLAQAFADATARMGPDASAWAWGRLHHAAFTHPLAGAVDVPPAWHIEALPMGGSSSTPMHTGYRPSDFRVMHGASFRMVVDLANPDGGVTVNSPGQSGDPRSPHYQDLAPLWSRGAYVPMLYTAEAVAAAAESVIEVVPDS